MEKALLSAAIAAVAEALIAAADELTALDQAIGDGDHGINMKRGAEAVLAERESLAEKPAGAAIKAAGTILVMKVGGASGPLYGTLLMSLGKSWPESLDRESFAGALETAVAAVMARGKSKVGQKTLLDVLVPVSAAVTAGRDLREIATAAGAAAAATVALQAERGRASFLGERSVGHMDPGARSSEIAIRALVDVLEQAA
ncbi:MAG: dihydroxyacetone kinase subunit DhaL [Rhodospirillales bacterium]